MLNYRVAIRPKNRVSGKRILEQGLQALCSSVRHPNATTFSYLNLP